MSSTYILQKDLPDNNAGAKFILGESGLYYSSAIQEKENSHCYGKHFIQNNPEWFKPEIEITFGDEIVSIPQQIENAKRDILIAISEFKIYLSTLKH